MAEAEDFLMHYGRKGMKWYQNIFSKKPSSGRTKRRENVKELSDKELRDRINRIQMEEQYARLTSNPTRVAKAKKWVGSVMGEVGKELAKTYVSSYSKGLINNQILKKAPNVAAVMGLKAK